MELCILDNFGWDLRTSTPLEFLHLVILIEFLT